MCLGNDVTLIVPTCNRPEMLKQCLASINNLSHRPASVIIMDQSDGDDSLIACRQFDVEYHYCTYKNKSRAVNEAIALSNTSWLSIIDDDTILSSNWLDVIIQKRNAFPDIKIIQGNIYSSPGYEDANEDIHKHEYIVRKKVITPLFLIGCNFAFCRELYNEVGPFNEEIGPGTIFKGGEDIEWGYRVFSAKNSLLITPELKLVHAAWRNNEELIQQMSNYGIAMAEVLKNIKQKSKCDFIYYLIRLELWLFFNIVVSKLKRQEIESTMYRSYRNQFKSTYNR